MIKLVNLIGEYIQFAAKSLVAHKLRSFLTTLGILIGVTTIITIFSTIEGLNHYVKKNFASIGGTSAIYVSRQPWVMMGDWWKYRNRPKITIDDYNFIKEHSKIAKYVSPHLETMLPVRYRSETMKNVYIEATNHDYLYQGGIELDRGRFITELDYNSAKPVCIIGRTIADKLFEKEDALNKRLKVGDRYFKVIGILKKRGSVFGFDLDKSILVPYFSLRNVIGPRQGIEIVVSSGDPKNIPELKDELTYLMRRARHLKPLDKNNFTINQQDQLADTYNKLTGTLYAIIFVIGSVSLLVGGIVIMNIMLVSVSERTKEIGIRKSIGASRTAILLQFLFEAIFIALIGGAMGLGLGFAAASWVLDLMSLDSVITAKTIMLAIGFSGFVGVASGFYPALKAARLNPIDALRFE